MPIKDSKIKRKKLRQSSLVFRANTLKKDETMQSDDIYDLAHLSDDVTMFDVDSIEFQQKSLAYKVSYIMLKDSTASSLTNREINEARVASTQQVFYDIDNKIQRTLSFTKIKKVNINTKNNKCIDGFVLDINSPKRAIWDIVVLGLLIYTIVVLPVRVSFAGDNDTVNAFDIIIDVLFLLDIIVSFFSAYRLPDGTQVKSFYLISLNYVKSWFFIDVIATFPFYLFTSSGVIAKLSLFARIPRLLKMVRLVRLIKLLRAYQLKKFFEKIGI